MPDVGPPVLERYGYTWIQHPDGLHYGPRYPGDDDTLVGLEAVGPLGHRSVRRGEYRYFLRDPEAEENRTDRFCWMSEDEFEITGPDGEERAAEETEEDAP